MKLWHVVVGKDNYYFDHKEDAEQSMRATWGGVPGVSFHNEGSTMYMVREGLFGESKVLCFAWEMEMTVLSEPTHF